MGTGVVRPSGTVTFVFTDLEGSTGLWEARPEQMRAAVARHDEIVGQLVTEYGGYVFSTAGDSFAIALSRARDAVEMTLVLQRHLAEERWEGPVLRARVGIHAGAADERDGDYFGPPLNRAARLMAAGHGGQVLCSATVADLARSDVSAAVVWTDLGEVRLRDLLEPMRVWQVSDAVDDTVFPPLRGLDRVWNNLPVQPSALVGRADDVEQVRGLVRAHQLVTLTGVGGCGKTRLALAVAAELADGFGDEVVFVDLAPVASEARVPEAVAEAGGFQVSTVVGGDRVGAVARFVADRDMLLVLDNCEHLVDPVADFAGEVLAAGGAARVLATSREPLEVDGEHAYRVPPLPVDDAGGDADAATSLLVERIRAADARFSLDDDAMAVARRLCRRLDGLPLAIELAAAQAAHTSVVDVFDRLDRRFEMLVGGRSHRRRRRHQTLEAVMDWSWELLDDDERSLLASLAVFAGPWTLDEAEAVCQHTVARPVTQVMVSLVTKSLVEPVEVRSRTRYRMLETVKLYARRRLDERGGGGAMLEVHRDHLLAWVDTASHDVQLASVDWAGGYFDDFADIVAAVDWSIDRGDDEQAARLVAAGSCLWRYSTGFVTAYGWVQTLLERELQPATRARLLLAGADAGMSIEVPGRRPALFDIIPHLAQAAAAVDESAIEAMALWWTGAVDLVPDNDRAKETIGRAAQAATTPYVKGWVSVWARLGEAVPRLGEPLDLAGFDLGPPDCASRSVATQFLLLNDAFGGRAEHARAHLAVLDEFERGTFIEQHRSVHRFEFLIEALAGDPRVAHDLAARTLGTVGGAADAWRPITMLGMAILRLRLDEPATALSYFERLKTSAMFFTSFYEIRRRLAHQACRELGDPELIEAARAAGRTLDIDTILEQELGRNAAIAAVTRDET